MFVIEIWYDDKVKYDSDRTRTIPKTERFKIAGEVIKFETKESAERFIEQNALLRTEPNWIHGLKKSNVLKLNHLQIIEIA
jgi:hypothetical protein